MSRKKIDRFVDDVRKLEDRHGVRVGFLTVDDGRRQLCSCYGIDYDDPLMKKHMEMLYETLMRCKDEKQ